MRFHWRVFFQPDVRRFLRQFAQKIVQQSNYEGDFHKNHDSSVRLRLEEIANDAIKPLMSYLRNNLVTLHEWLCEVWYSIAYLKWIFSLFNMRLNSLSAAIWLGIVFCYFAFHLAAVTVAIVKLNQTMRFLYFLKKSPFPHAASRVITATKIYFFFVLEKEIDPQDTLLLLCFFLH